MSVLKTGHLHWPEVLSVTRPVVDLSGSAPMIDRASQYLRTDPPLGGAGAGLTNSVALEVSGIWRVRAMTFSHVGVPVKCTVLVVLAPRVGGVRNFAAAQVLGALTFGEGVVSTFEDIGYVSSAPDPGAGYDFGLITQQPLADAEVIDWYVEARRVAE